LTRTEILKMSWTEFDEARKETDLVIVPVGSIEVFGPHLPLGSDTLIAERLARRLSEMINAIVAPVVPVGYTRPLMEFPGSLTVTPDQLREYLTGICDSLMGWGFKRILFFNVHRRNVPTIDQICLEYLIPQKIKAAQVFWWQMVENNGKHLMTSPDSPFGHAGEACTAVLMEVAPELVNMEVAVNTKNKTKTDYPEIYGYSSFRASTDSGILGYPDRATPEKGKEVVRICLERICNFVKNEMN
jgi:creatinine amidohydrolase